MIRDDFRDIPSITAIVDLLRNLGVVVSDASAVDLARSVQRAMRTALVAAPSLTPDDVLDREIGRIERLINQSRYRRVINGTGIVVHTNLGRAPVSQDTARAMSEAAIGSVSLEIEPESGRRGGRMSEITALLHLLTGAEAALVVNNNAAAILLTLSALASGRTVAVSRAEAVEIGGGFRIPDVLRQSGADLLEVGTTNRTYASDYRHPEIAEGSVILKVHSSNFAISGFVSMPTLAEMREVADERGATLIEDLGSGTLVDTSQFGIEHEPTVSESLAAGVDVVTFSGDKLLGGPQAGIVAGRKELVARIERHPLARAVRADKATLAGIAATLRHYLRGDATESVPVLRIMTVNLDELRRRAASLKESLHRGGSDVAIVETTNYVGGGSLPGQSLPGVALRVDVPGVATDELARQLRLDRATPVYGRIEGGALLIELRTVDPKDDDVLVETVLKCATIDDGVAEAGDSA